MTRGQGWTTGVETTGSIAGARSAAAAETGLARSDVEAMVAEFRLTALPDAFYADPFPFYRTLRERSPVHRMSDGSYFLTRYRDLEAIYKDPVIFRSDKKVEFKPKFVESLYIVHHTMSLVLNDRPRHTL